MVFWCQRRCRIDDWPRGYRLWEGAVRCLRFRVAKPGALERDGYSPPANGDPDWNREPWGEHERGRMEKMAKAEGSAMGARVPLLHRNELSRVVQ